MDEELMDYSISLNEY